MTNIDNFINSILQGQKLSPLETLQHNARVDVCCYLLKSSYANLALLDKYPGDDVVAAVAENIAEMPGIATEKLADLFAIAEAEKGLQRIVTPLTRNDLLRVRDRIMTRRQRAGGFLPSPSSRRLWQLHAVQMLATYAAKKGLITLNNEGGNAWIDYRQQLLTR